MGVHLKYINSDEVYNNTTCKRIIVNDLPNRTSRDKANINSLLMLEVGDVFDNVPRCSCGALTMKIYKGVTCSNCDTVVEEIVSDHLDNKVWVRAPEGVPALMNPKMWHQLQAYLERSNFKFNLLQWLTDPDYKPKITKITGPIRMALAKLDSLGMNVRSYQHFYDNFDAYLEVLLTQPEFNNKFNTIGLELLKLFKQYRHCVWVQHVQVPNKALTVVENSNGKKWIDASTPKLLKAVRLMVGIDNKENSMSVLSVRTKCARSSRFLSFMGDYYDREINPKVLGKKPGLIRKHMLATRSNYSARFVVTAIAEPHDYDEVHFPWSGFMNMFSPHIKAKLYHHYKMSSDQIMKIMTQYQTQYHPKLHEIFLELIREATAPNGKSGIPVLINRNPTLKHGSIVLLRLTNVKVDTRDLSASTSGSIAALYNGDYDGDVETFQCLMDNRTARAFQPFEAKYSVNNLLDPYTAAGVINLPKPTVLSMVVQASHVEKPTKENLDFMAKFAA